MTCLRQDAALPLEEGAPLPPDDRLTVSAIRNDLDYLYREQSHRLVRRLTRHTGCREAARDLTQEAFLRLAQLAPVRSLIVRHPQSYLTRVSTNLVRDWGRSRVRRGIETTEGLEITAGQDQVAVLESRDTLRRVEQALSRMKPKTREIFLAHRLDGLSYAEIAERTGLSISGVEKQMIKAIAKIDRFLDRA